MDKAEAMQKKMLESIKEKNGCCTRQDCCSDQKAGI